MGVSPNHSEQMNGSGLWGGGQSVALEVKIRKAVVETIWSAE